MTVTVSFTEHHNSEEPAFGIEEQGTRENKEHSAGHCMAAYMTLWHSKALGLGHQSQLYLFPTLCSMRSYKHLEISHDMSVPTMEMDVCHFILLLFYLLSHRINDTLT